jgi:opacity protein-like surface antigen
VLGRLGVYHGERETTGDALVNEKTTNTDLTYGLGAQYDFNRNLGLRLEWQRYNRMGGGLLGKSDTDNVSLGALWRFQ